MRIAFVDLMFSWPPHGGADVDLYHLMTELHTAGHDVHLFGVSDPTVWERGAFLPDSLPFPATKMVFKGRAFKRQAIAETVRGAVDAWKPQAVFVADGFFLKPYIIAALAQYPVAVRYYAHEAICHRDILRFKDGAPCPNHYLQTAETCRRCALETIGPAIRQGLSLAWIQEYQAARAFAPEYHAALLTAMRQVRAALVYNEQIKSELEGYCPKVFVVPGGVDVNQYAYCPPPERNAADMKRILMCGRAEDPAKGLSVLMEAGDRLARTRADFEIVATIAPDTPGPPWFKAVGWQDRAGTVALYRDADCCVTPSLWDEPFGLVALEAMAIGRPVCASRVGGLTSIVSEGETGFLFERGDSAQLAEILSRLLEDRTLRVQMGQAGRRRADQEYSWRSVVDTFYPPVWSALGG